MGERPGPMKKEPEHMSIGIVRSVSGVFSGFLAVIFWVGTDAAGAMGREEVSRADNDNLEASEKGCKAPEEGSHDKSCCSHLPLWHCHRALVGLQAQQGSPVNR